MKSTELSTALEILARGHFAQLVRERRPYAEGRRKDRAASFLHCWQVACGLAGQELSLGYRDPLVIELGRAVPTNRLEVGQSDSGHAG